MREGGRVGGSVCSLIVVGGGVLIIMEELTWAT